APVVTLARDVRVVLDLRSAPIPFPLWPSGRHWLHPGECFSGRYVPAGSSGGESPSRRPGRGPDGRGRSRKDDPERPVRPRLIRLLPPSSATGPPDRDRRRNLQTDRMTVHVAPPTIPPRRGTVPARDLPAGDQRDRPA